MERRANMLTGRWIRHEGVAAPWCNPLTLQPEQSGEVGSNPGAPTLECHDKGSRTRLVRSALFLRSQRLALKNATSPSPLPQRIKIASMCILAPFLQCATLTIHAFKK